MNADAIIAKTCGLALSKGASASVVLQVESRLRAMVAAGLPHPTEVDLPELGLRVTLPRTMPTSKRLSPSARWVRG